MEFVDYYKLLGIDKKATAKEIKTAYRKLARKFHPDLNPNDKNAKKNFQQINEANEVLSDPVKRKKYDEHDEDWKNADQHQEQRQQQQQNRQQQSGRQRGGFSGKQSEGDFSDFFAAMFGGGGNTGRSRQTKFRGEDYNAELHLELIEAYKTHKQTLTVNGKKLRITIPAGIENEQTIKLTGYGGEGINGGPNGDLYIKFSIASHPVFKRSGNNLYLNFELNLYTAVLGGEITIETLSGKVKLKVKPETQNGTMVKLSGKGFPVYKEEGRFGDLYITYTLKIQTNLTEKQKKLFQELSEL